MSAAETAATIVSLEGRVERVTFYNPQTGFSVVRLRAQHRREPVAVVGALPAVQPGERLSLTGHWQTDPRHGAQFRVVTVTVQPPAGKEDIVRYLGSGLIAQIGPVLAERIVTTFGDETLAILDATPERVREVPGIGQRRATALAAAWRERRALLAISAFLSEHRLDTRYAPRLLTAYGAEAPRILAANPYRLVGEVQGLGFAAADRLGQALAVRPTAPARLQAAVQASLLRAGERGHTRLDPALLVNEAATLAGVTPDLMAAAITQLTANGTIGVTAVTPAATDHGPLFAAPSPPAPVPTSRGRLRVYEPATPVDPPGQATTSPAIGVGLLGLVRAEEGLATGLRMLVGQPSVLAPSVVDRWLARDQAAQRLSAEQQAAVRGAAVTRLFVLTGGPGVGKTTTVTTLVRLLTECGRSVALAAPTGKAAKRLSEVVGAEARTLHRLLGAGPQGFQHGLQSPLPADVIIVDEASMLDTQLARSLVAAIGPASQLILVGDADQLPAVGPGQVLRDLLASQRVPAVRLQTVFRQAAESQIIANAHRIRQGLLPDLAEPAALLRESDCIFVAATPERVPTVATTWAADRLPRALGLAPTGVQVLAPLTRVCQAMNAALQSRLNPPGAAAERPHGALPLRVGDRVIQTRNNYLLGDGVFNGDTGVITAIDGDTVQVDLGDGRLVDYAPADLLDIDHAYCLTVHRAQGSEWPAVVLLLSSSYEPMLTRTILYTGLTRARRAAVIIGDEAAVARAVAEIRDQARSTGLADLLRQGEASDGGR